MPRKSLMPAKKPIPELLTIYAKNIDLMAFKRGWSMAYLAELIGVTVPTLTRVRLRHNKYIDPEIFASLLRVFECRPDDLLSAHSDIDYTGPST
jgi:DNA-binding Xre family transcriptional regulator